MEYQLKQSSNFNLVSLLPKVWEETNKKKVKLHLPITETQNAAKVMETIGGVRSFNSSQMRVIGWLKKENHKKV